MKLGEKIKLLRTEQEMTQPTLADKAGIEQSYLSKLENDKGSPSFDIINRIAMALGLSGMELINSLSQDYIETRLCYLPEVAAAYETVRLRRQARVRNRLLASALAMVLGAGLAYLGYSGVFFPERAYDYRSAGVIREGEPDNLFAFAFPTGQPQFQAPNAAQEAAMSRVDVITLVSYDYLGKSFSRNMDGGKRLFEEYSTRRVERRENDILLALGIMLFVAGLLGLTYRPVAATPTDRKIP